MVTNLELSGIQSPQRLYEQVYCARGEMENRIKEQQLCLFADRTSSATMRANQLRLYLSTFAYVLMNTVREVGLAGTAMAKAQCSTIRLKLFKIAAVIRITTRKVWLSLSSVHPFQYLYATALRNLRAPRMRRRWRAEPALSADRRLAAGVAPVRLRIRSRAPFRPARSRRLPHGCLVRPHPLHPRGFRSFLQDSSHQFTPIRVLATIGEICGLGPTVSPALRRPGSGPRGNGHPDCGLRSRPPTS